MSDPIGDKCMDAIVSALVTVFLDCFNCSLGRATPTIRRWGIGNLPNAMIYKSNLLKLPFSTWCNSIYFSIHYRIFANPRTAFAPEVRPANSASLCNFSDPLRARFRSGSSSLDGLPLQRARCVDIFLARRQRRRIFPRDTWTYHCTRFSIGYAERGIVHMMGCGRTFVSRSLILGFIADNSQWCILTIRISSASERPGVVSSRLKSSLVACSTFSRLFDNIVE